MLQVESTLSSIPLTPNGKHTSRSGHIVEEIRKRFLEEEWATNRDLYDETDVERMRNSEWFVKRYLLACRRNQDEAYEMMKTTLAWRKTVALTSTPINSFPKEFFQIGGLFQYEPDREGNPVIYMRIRMHRKIIELQEPIQQFLFFLMNKVDQESNGSGTVILFDCSGAGYANMDLDMLKALVDITFKYFPFSVKSVIVYELSWMLNAFRRIAMTIIPSSFAKIVHFANKDDISNFIAPENLPDFMGGTCKRNYRSVPEGCPVVDTLALDRGYTMSDVERIKAIFKPYLDEAEAAIAAQQAIEEIPVEVLEETHQREEKPNEQVDSEEVFQSDSVAIVRTQNKSFEEYASLYPQNEVFFRRTSTSTSQWPNKGESVLCGTVLLRNNHESKPLAFKIQCTNAAQYSVTPNQGVILSGAFVCINMTAKSPAKVSMNKDKFMILLCPEVVPEKDLVNWRQFGKLFVERGNKVYSHRLKARLYDDSADLTDGVVPGQRPTKVTQLRQEVDQLKKRCGRLHHRLQWLNRLIFLFVCLTLLLIVLLFKGGLPSDYFDAWHESNVDIMKPSEL